MNTPHPDILALGPWDPKMIQASWLESAYQPSEQATAHADVELEKLRERGSPSHDGLAARLADWSADEQQLTLELQPARWALRLVSGSEFGSLSVLCAVRSADGRWLAGRRAAWVASWAGRWALGAGGAVEVNEDPIIAMRRELEEEWSVEAATLSIEALVRAPSGMALLIGLATLAEGSEVTRDPEHDEHAWWPSNPADWPAEADDPLRVMAALLTR